MIIYIILYNEELTIKHQDIMGYHGIICTYIYIHGHTMIWEYEHRFTSYLDRPIIDPPFLQIYEIN